jgi:hypothetical protein
LELLDGLDDHGAFGPAALARKYRTQSLSAISQFLRKLYCVKDLAISSYDRFRAA